MKRTTCQCAKCQDPKVCECKDCGQKHCHIVDGCNRSACIEHGDGWGNVHHRYVETWCSECGDDLGPGDSGVSHCDEHEVAA
jgi:hypothetical protein